MGVLIRIALAGLLLAGGCFSPDQRDGAVSCASDGSCPPGFECDQRDDLCYRELPPPGQPDARPVADALAERGRAQAAPANGSQLSSTTPTTQDVTPALPAHAPVPQLVGTEASTLSFDAHPTVTAESQWSAGSGRTLGTILLIVGVFRRLSPLLLNLLALGAPIFTMNVYDRVVPNGAIPSLVALAIGAVYATWSLRGNQAAASYVTEPAVRGGLTAEASDKMARFVDLCDQFRLPVANFVDQPGFVIGTAAERAGTIRRGTRALYAGYQATVPWVSVLVRKVFGVAGAAHRPGSRPCAPRSTGASSCWSPPSSRCSRRWPSSG